MHLEKEIYQALKIPNTTSHFSGQSLQRLHFPRKVNNKKKSLTNNIHQEMNECAKAEKVGEKNKWEKKQEMAN